MDFSGKLTLFLHLTVAILRVLEDYQSFNGVLSNVLGTFCQMLIWFSIYYFIFEMKIIKIALYSSNPEDYQVRLQLYTPLKWAILSFLIVYGLLMSTLVGI